MTLPEILYNTSSNTCVRALGSMLWCGTQADRDAGEDWTAAQTKPLSLENGVSADAPAFATEESEGCAAPSKAPEDVPLSASGGLCLPPRPLKQLIRCRHMGCALCNARWDPEERSHRESEGKVGHLSWQPSIETAQSHDKCNVCHHIDYGLTISCVLLLDLTLDCCMAHCCVLTGEAPSEDIARRWLGEGICPSFFPEQAEYEQRVSCTLCYVGDNYMQNAKLELTCF